jgi:hypothetical protein
VALAAWLIWSRLNGVVLSLGENHIGILLVMLLCEPAGRLREGDVFVWLSVALIAAGIVTAGAWAPLSLAVLVIVAGASDFSQQPVWRRRLLWLAWLAPVLLAAVLAGLWGGVGISARLAIWQDGLSLLGQSWPWGAGFGSFRWVFPVVAEALPKPGVRALHPENAYLWFAIEGGAFAMAWLALFWGGRRRHGQAAKSARLALLVLAVECLIETPVLWSPIVWLLPVLLNQGFVWRGSEPPATQKLES